MSNMSYCRFYNTNLDLADCIYDLEERLENDGLDEYDSELSKMEKDALEELMERIQFFVDYEDEIREIIFKENE